MIIELCIAGYIIGALAFAYIIGAVECKETAPLALIWPCWIFVFILIAPLFFVGRLGERHR